MTFTEDVYVDGQLEKVLKSNNEELCITKLSKICYSVRHTSVVLVWLTSLPAKYTLKTTFKFNKL